MRTRRTRAALAIPFVGVLAVGAYLAFNSKPAVRRDRVYRIGFQNVSPFLQKDANGEPSGLAVDVVREAARRRGIKLRWVWSPGSSEDALRNNSVDLWPLITITPERSKFLYISAPYLQHDNIFLVSATSPFKQPQDLAAGTISHQDLPIRDRLARQLLPRARLVSKRSIRDALDELCRQHVDAAFLEEFGGMSVLLSGLSCAEPLRVIPIPNLQTRLGVGSTFAARAAADEIRAGIGDIADGGDLPPILARWGYVSRGNVDSMNELLRAKRREPWLMAASGLFALLFAVTLIAAYRHRRQSNRIRAADRALSRSEQKLRMMANNLNDMVLAYDMDRRLDFATPSVRVVTGYSATELASRDFAAWVHPDDRSRMFDLWQKLFGGCEFRNEEYRLITKSGDVKWAIATWVPVFDETGRQVGVQGSEREITATKKAEESLRESERRFRELLQNVQLVAIIIDLDGKISFFNDHAVSLTGWSREEVIGRLAGDLLDPEYLLHLAEVIHPGQHRAFRQPLIEGTILSKNRTHRWIQWSSTAVLDSSGRTVGFASLGSDVTELKALRASAAMQESESRFRNMADSAPVMIWVSGVDKGYTFFNKVWLNFTGKSMGRELGHGWVDGIHPDDVAQRLAIYSSCFEARRTFEMEYRLRRADGRYRWVLDRGVPTFDTEGTFTGYIGSCMDITDLKRTQEENIARQKLESLGMLAGGIAHDFNNLLGGVLAHAELGLVELMEGSQPNEELERIRAVAIRGAEIVRQLMVYAGQESAIFELVNVPRLVDDMLELLKISMSKNAELQLCLDSGLPAVRANPAQLRQVVMNLVTNASDAIGENPGTIRVSTSAVLINPGSALKVSERITDGKYLQLEIADTGCGISTEVQANIFDPFFTTKSAGHGLGLAVVDGVIRTLGGNINLSSEIGKGTTIKILLPAAVDETADVVERAFPQPGSPEEMRTGTILVVEDEDVLRLAVSKMLRMRGYSVLEARDGSRAVEHIRTHHDEIAILVLDITLPGMPSRQVLDHVRRLQPGIRIILTSAYGQNVVDASFDGVEVKHFIRKPYRIGELEQVIHLALSGPSAAPRTRTAGG